jgi:hypothetical protein
MVVGTASTMVTARPEQNQILIQHPDAPSPAQPQVSCALGRALQVCCPYSLCYICFSRIMRWEKNKFSFWGNQLFGRLTTAKQTIHYLPSC